MVLIHLTTILEGVCISVRVTSSEGGFQMNGSHLRVARCHLGTPAYSIRKLRGYLLPRTYNGTPLTGLQVFTTIQAQLHYVH